MTGRKAVLTGGCQCGAIRFAVYAEPVKVGLCHCRMCQKAVAGPFISLAEVRHEDFAWTRGQPASFRSSTIAERNFCAACGTPLSYRQIGGPYMELTTGSFDRPDLVTPTYATGTESRLPWVGSIDDLPGRTTGELAGAQTLARIVSHQHPDHDT
ncbi:GFA family protein [Bradyrhizobium sp. LHD-71]|uniref:GFA family protein n=1 Tax=Bradyrhizobium sp. LHD-71 TaxID=3072141 RepID=UPI00280F718B|nr:GFA family protein [Bradyrhizobium sp. LHD-71]MDQ8728546.1 GFA family protein [Bradyrhizobium sp. LHD-71]